MSSKIFEIKGVILGYKKSRAVQYNNKVLVKLFVEPTIVATTIGRKVVIKDRYNNIYRGRIVRVHSQRNSVVVVKFKPNIPGQLIGQTVDVI